MIREQQLLTSILMPVKDEAAYIIACLESVRAASMHTPLEVIIVDDHSIDDTAKLIHEYARNYPDFSIKYLLNGSKGKAAALNLAFKNAEGSRIILLAGDDILAAEALPMRVEAISSEKTPQLVSCRYRTFSDQLKFDGIIFPRSTQKDHIAGGAVCFNKAFANLYFPIPETLPNEDSWMRAILILHDISCLRIDDIGLHYRIHSGNSSGLSQNFFTTSSAISKRSAAYKYALLEPGGSEKGRAKLASLVQAEGLRQAGRWYAIPFVPNLARSDALVAIVNTTPWLYALKSLLSRILNAK